jgi:hypothetical protein
MGLTYHFKIRAPASVSPEELEVFLKKVEDVAKQAGFKPTVEVNSTYYHWAECPRATSAPCIPPTPTGLPRTSRLASCNEHHPLARLLAAEATRARSWRSLEASKSLRNPVAISWAIS